MKLRSVVTFKDDGSLKARLVVQGFTEQGFGKIPTSSPTAFRRSRRIFLTLAASLGFQTHKGDVKCAFLRGDLDEQHADDNHDDAGKIESAQLQLEHHQCVRLFKAVYGLFNAPRRYHRVATDLRNKRGEESLVESCWWTFRDENGVIHALCLVHVDDFMLACSDSPFGKHVFDSINNHECSHSAAHESHNLTTNTPEPGADLRSVSQNTRKIFRSPTCHHIDAETGNRKSLHLSCLNFGLERSVALVGYAMFATVLGAAVVVHGDQHRKPQYSKSMLIILLLWLRTQMRDGPLDQTGQLVLIANAELLQSKESNMSLISWHSSRLRRVARSSSAMMKLSTYACV